VVSLQRAVSWVCVVLAFCFTATMGARAAHAWRPPALTRPVTDMAGVMSPEAIGAVERGLLAHRTATGNQVAVLLVGSTGSEPIEDFAIQVASEWRGGEAGRDNGVLVVLAVNDRRSRIEVGYGLESTLTDATAKQILDGARPLLKSENYDGAITQIVNGVLGRSGAKGAIELPAIRSVPVRLPPSPPLRTYSPPPAPSGGCNGDDAMLVLMVLGGLVFMIVIGLARNPNKGGTTFSGSGYSSGSSSTSSFWTSSSSSSSGSSWDSSSSSSGSSWGGSSSSSSSSSDYGGGGGSFGGGGASSSW
jgi:uncharacterized protein